MTAKEAEPNNTRDIANKNVFLFPILSSNTPCGSEVKPQERKLSLKKITKYCLNEMHLSSKVAKYLGCL